MMFNARSICNKATGIIEFLKDNGCDICFITETWLKKTDKTIIAEIKDLGYNIYSQSRSGRGGGICTLFKPNINAKQCKIQSYSSFECLEITVKNNSDLLIIIVIYRTGKMDLEKREIFMSEIDHLL